MNNTTCPVCDYEHPEGHSVNVEFNSAYQDMSCPNCNAAWTDCYAYTGAAMYDSDYEDTHEH